MNEDRVEPTSESAAKAGAASRVLGSSWVAEVNASHASGPRHIPHPLAFVAVLVEEAIAMSAFSTVAVLILVPEELGLADTESADGVSCTPDTNVSTWVRNGDTGHAALSLSTPGCNAGAFVRLAESLITQGYASNLEL